MTDSLNRIEHIKANGTVMFYEARDGRSLAWLQDKVNGYIEIIHFPSGALMVVNDEAAINNSLRNDLASRIAGRDIYGDVIFAHTSGAEEIIKGEDVRIDLAESQDWH